MERPAQEHPTLGHKQTENICDALMELQHVAHHGNWSHQDAHRTAGLIVMCILDESDGWIYASKAVPESLSVPHDKIGSDHLSVGLFQQQSPMWGSARSCMMPESSCLKFLTRLMNKGLTRHGSMPWHEAVQAVQVSAYPDGSNYARFYDATHEFLKAHWNTEQMKVRK